MTVFEMLDKPPSPETGRALLDWARNLPGRIVSGDMMIGLLALDEVELAPTAFRRASDCGIREALLDLGNWLASPPIGDPDPDAACAVFHEAIAAGIPGAKLRFVEFNWFHTREEATVEQQRETLVIARELAAGGEDQARAVHLLGLLTFAGFGADPDPVAACAIQKRAAELGSSDALFELFLYHETGAGTAKDSAGAFEYLTRAADAGHDRAMYNLAAFFATGRGVPKDFVEAARWYRKSSEAGNVRATANLAGMYARGEGVPKDLEQAKLFFDEAEYMGMDVTDARARAGV
jgi:TPR repeat protein